MGLISTATLMLCLGLQYRSSSAAWQHGLDDIGSICQTMWNADQNSLVYGVDFRIDLQSRAVSYRDAAPRRLFTYVNERKLRKPTFVAFKDLLDNYVMKIGITEVLTTREKDENRRFLRAIMSTQTMKELHNYLASRGKVPRGTAQFEQKLYVMWFYFYGRAGYRDSSGFEHVFLGEVYSKNGENKVKGFHNWLQFYLEEKTNAANYHGFYKALQNKPRRLKLKFKWNNYDKPVSSFFLGTSPEFEMALYTACFILKPGLKCSCRINSQTITVQTYTHSGGKYVGTAFPVV